MPRLVAQRQPRTGDLPHACPRISHRTDPHRVLQSWQRRRHTACGCADRPAFGRYSLKMNPVILFGACAGAGTGRAENSHHWANRVELLERACELIVDAVEALPSLGWGAGVGKEIALLAARTAVREFTSGGAYPAPVQPPLTIPFVCRSGLTMCSLRFAHGFPLLRNPLPAPLQGAFLLHIFFPGVRVAHPRLCLFRPSGAER